METLSPSVLEHLGLGAAIEDCLRRGSERSGFKVRFKNKLSSDDLDCLSMVEQVLLYRLAQESITNICKHAGASTVRATLEREENNLAIRIVDDGKGMDLAKARGDSRGMKYQRYRADLVGAIIGWAPGENGKGTTVEISVDLSDRIPADGEKQLVEEPEGTD
jgi:two-component system sensor histidine kinase UhpB